jgi:uncharacterized protein YjbJ (UPF0337 family)
MNKDILQGKWEQVKGTIQKNWGELTNDELAQIEGDYTKLKGFLQEKYGYTREETEKVYNELFGSYDLIEDPLVNERVFFDEEEHLMREETVHRRRDDFIETEDELYHDDTIGKRHVEVEDDRGILEKIGDFLMGNDPDDVDDHIKDERYVERDILTPEEVHHDVVDDRVVVDPDDPDLIRDRYNVEHDPEILLENEVRDEDVLIRQVDDIGYDEVDPGLDPDLHDEIQDATNIIHGEHKIDSIDPVKQRVEYFENDILQNPEGIRDDDLIIVEEEDDLLYREDLDK